MVRIVTELGDELANQRPAVPDSNSPYAILANLEPYAPPRGHPKHQEDAGLPMHRTQGGALIHAYEDLARHRGQMEITRDMIRVSIWSLGRG